VVVDISCPVSTWWFRRKWLWIKWYFSSRIRKYTSCKSSSRKPWRKWSPGASGGGGGAGGVGGAKEHKLAEQVELVLIFLDTYYLEPTAVMEQLDLGSTKIFCWWSRRLWCYNWTSSFSWWWRSRK
jgi:hypothetical protein